MYTRSGGRKSVRVIPAAEPKEQSAQGSFKASPRRATKSPTTAKPKSSNSNPSKESPAKKAKESDEGIFQGIRMHFVPVELPKARRDLFARRVAEHGGLVVRELKDLEHDDKPVEANIVIVADGVSIRTLCLVLDKDPQRVLQYCKTISIVRAKWLSRCLQTKTLVEMCDSKLNDFIKNQVESSLLAADDPSEDGKPLSRSPLPTFLIDRCPSPARDASYHSDDDHKSVASDLSENGDDFDQSFGDDSPAAKLQRNNIFLSPSAPAVGGNSGVEGGGHDGISNRNQLIIEQLEEMMRTYRNLGDQFRGYAYARAISAIRKYGKPIVSFQQIKELKNVGPRITSHITEILETGRMEKNQNNESDEVTAAMKLFVNVHGVGTKTAKKWVHMVVQIPHVFGLRYVPNRASYIHQGLRSLKDVKEKVALTVDQEIGMKYYNEFLDKMPRSEVEEIAELVESTTSSIKEGFIFRICGSYVRGREFCGDVDLLMTHPDNRSHEMILKPLLTRLREIGFLTDDLWISEGRHKKYLGVCKLPYPEAKHRRLDIIIPPYNEWATCVLGWSGSMYFVRSIRDYAHKKGMSLTDYSLNKNVIRVNGEKVNEGDPVDTPTEESIFEALGLPFLRPEERDH